MTTPLSAAPIAPPPTAGVLAHSNFPIAGAMLLAPDITSGNGARASVLIRPRSLNLQAIDTCNSRCVMCNIWKDGRREKMTLDQLRKHLAHPFFSEVAHVGVTGGEPTLRKDLVELYRLLPQCLPKLAGASFITHGMQTKRAVEFYSEVHEHYRRLHLAFDGMVSLDGVGEAHDRVRGRKGAFASATQTLLALKERGVPVMAACTIVRSNVYGLHDLLDWGRAHGVYVRFRVAEFIRRLYNDSCAGEIRGFNPRELRHLVSFFHLLLTEYETNETIQKTYRSILSLLTGGERLIGCPYQKGLAVNVDSVGSLACCAPKGTAFEMTPDADEVHSTLVAQRAEVAAAHCAHCIHDYHDDWNEKTLQQVVQARDRSRELYEVPDEALTTPEVRAQPLELASLKQILLAGWYGTETAGDIAILQGIIAEYLQVNPQLQFQVLSLYPYYTRTTIAVWPEEFRARVRIIDYASEDAWQATLDCDALVMAGGPLMDIHETRKILCLFKRFADLGKPRIIEGCGVGPLNRAEYRWNVCRIARLATRISVRDRASREALRAFGIRKDIEVRPDPATTYIRAQGIRHHGLKTKVEPAIKSAGRSSPASLSPQRGEGMRVRGDATHDVPSQVARQNVPTPHPSPLPVEGRGGRISAPLVPLPAKIIRCFLRELTSEYPQSLSPAQATDNLTTLLRRLLDWYPEHRIELWAMHHFPVGYDDRLFARQLVRQIANPRLTCDWEPRSPKEILEAMAAADFCVCMRFHSCVFAAEISAPFLAIDYTAGGKIQGFLEDAQQEHRLCGLADLATMEKNQFEEKVLNAEPLMVGRVGPRAPTLSLESEETASVSPVGDARGATRPTQGQESVAPSQNSPRVLHIIQSVTGGGGARAMIALAKHSHRLGGFEHRAVSLLPADATGLELAHQAGVQILNSPHLAELCQAMADADLVLVHWWNNPELAALFRRELPPIRLALWLHVGGYHSPQVLTPSLIDFADLAVACSPHTYAHPVFANLPEESRAQRTAMVLAGADFDRLRGMTPRAHEGFQIGYVGTLDPVKMHADFVSMNCAVRVPDAKFVVCGGGDSRWLVDQAEKLGRSTSFAFQGHIEDVRGVLETLDVYGYPLCADTYAAAELNLQEVMFAGVPVVAFPHGGIRQLIQHGETGLLVETPEAYARAIEHLHKNPTERARLGANAAVFAREFWGAGNAAREFNVHFRRLLAQPKREREWDGKARSDAPHNPSIGGYKVELVHDLAIHPGARMFVESLAEGAQPFLDSLTPARLEDTFAAEERIAGLPRLMHYTGVLSYRNAHPKDSLLQLWAGLGFLHSGQADDALGAFALAQQNGFTPWRIHWYRALAAELAGKCADAVSELQLVVESAPEFAPARDMLRELGFVQLPATVEPSPGLSEAARGCVQQAERLLQQGELANARDWLERALDIVPNQPDLTEALRELDGRLGNMDAGLASLSPPPGEGSTVSGGDFKRLSNGMHSDHSDLSPRGGEREPDIRSTDLSVSQFPSHSPLVSVLLSTYASEKFLRACLEDLQAQTIAGKIEIIVIDSGSPENERAIVEEFQKRYANIRYVRTERETLYAAWNRGVQMARGKYVTNANADDSHRADALELLVAALEANPEADLSYGDYYTTLVPNDSFAAPSPLRLNQHPPYHPAILHFYCVTGCHPMWRRTVFNLIGLFDTQYTAPGDYEFLLRFASHGLRAVHVPQPLSLFYQNQEGLSFKSRERSEREFKAIQTKYRAEMPIERLFRVDPADAASVAGGWTALGNLAMSYEAPWFDNACQDFPFALHCYQTALRHDAENAAARFNLVITTALHEPAKLESMLLQLPSEELCRAKQAIANGRYELIPVDVPPAVEPLEHGRIQARISDSLAPLRGEGSRRERPSGVVASPVRFLGAFFDSTEAASTARTLVPKLASYVTLGTLDRSAYSEVIGASMLESDREVLRDCFRHYPFLRGGVVISHGAAIDFQVPADTSLRVGWTSFPFVRVPERWITACQQMDEVWVPSALQLEAFAAGGVPRTRLAVMPTPVDDEVFNPAAHKPWPLPNRARHNFLAFVDASRQNGWDVLLAAYLREFSAADDVCLYLVPDAPARNTDVAVLEKKVRDFISTLSASLSPLSGEGGGTERPALPIAINYPRVEWLGNSASFADRPRLYRAVDCFVSPRRGMAWGTDILEAMAMARPVIATDWSGQRGLDDVDHVLPLSFEVAPVTAADAEEWIGLEQAWANPSESHLRELLRRVVREPDDMRWLGYRAREYVQAQHSPGFVADLVAARLRQLERGMTSNPLEGGDKLPQSQGAVDSVRISWEGTFRDLGSLSHVNRELTRPLAAHANVTLTCIHSEEPPRGKTSADITVRHEWPPRWQRPASGAWVVIQPWEFGALPAEWVRELKNVDEVWTPSKYVRRVYLDSGVPAAKVKVLPNGIDPAHFHLNVAPLALPTRKQFKFLFVGGTIQRKGPDVLLESFLARFTAHDDACLVIKDFGGQGIYAGQTFAEQIHAAQQKPGAPEIIYLTDDLSAEQVAALYTACDCLVHPYRGEGFALPVLEAMACGLPVIVTAGGATDDFATDEWAYRIPALRKPIVGSIAGMLLAGRGWWLEPDAAALGEQMRWIMAHRDVAWAKGRAASDYVRREWTWAKSATVAAQLARDLKSRLNSVAETVTAERLLPRIASCETTVRAVAQLGDLDHAQELLRLGSHLEAWKETLNALRARPFHPAAWLLLAEIALAAGDSAQARRCAERARAFAPQWKSAKQFLSRSLKGNTHVEWPEVPAASASPRLSVCLIAKNEEQFLGRCLESIRSIANQIVVVDTGSTDRTVEIAREHGAVVHEFAWCDDFSAARNAALTHATGDWILILDADEELSAASVEKLRRDLQNSAVMAYRLPIVDAGREEEGCHYIPRLFRNAPGLHFAGRIHEQLFPSLEPLRRELGLENKLGTATLRHHGYTDEVTNSRGKVERNLRLLRLAIAETPGDANLLMNLGLELTRAEQSHAGLEAYDQAWLALSAQPVEAVPAELRETLLMQYATHLLRAGCGRQLLELFETPQGRAADGNASLHFLRGMAAMKLNRWKLAVEQMRRCLARRDQPSLTTIHADIRTVAPRHCLALSLTQTKDFDGAAQAFGDALREAPDNYAVQFDYAGFLFARGRDVDALQQLHQLAGRKPGEVTVWQSGGKVALSRPEFLEVALDWTEAAHRQFPADTVIGLQRAEALLLAGQAQNAARLWDAFRNPLDPVHSAAHLICEVVTGITGPALALSTQSTTAREVLHWFQRLVAQGAGGVVRDLASNLELLQRRCPAAAEQVENIFAQAGMDAVAV